jgi:hypothetical protein
MYQSRVFVAMVLMLIFAGSSPRSLPSHRPALTTWTLQRSSVSTVSSSPSSSTPGQAKAFARFSLLPALSSLSSVVPLSSVLSRLTSFCKTSIALS